MFTNWPTLDCHDPVARAWVFYNARRSWALSKKQPKSDHKFMQRLESQCWWNCICHLQWPTTDCKFLLWSEVSQRLSLIMGTAWLTVITLTLFSKRFTMSKYCHCMSGDSCANLDAWALAKSAAVRPREVFWRGSAPAPRRIPGCLRDDSRKRENLSSYVELLPFLLFYRKKIAHGKVERLAISHQGLSLASFVCDFLGGLHEKKMKALQ